MINTIQSSFEAHKNKSLELRHEPIQNRIARLKALRSWILNNKDRIRKALYQDLKKPETDTDISEIFTVTSELNKAIKHIKQWTRPEHVSPGLTYLGTSAYIHYEPKGATLIIAPWNFPFNLVCVPLVSALAAGNTAILKPSELTPATSTLIVEMVKEVFDPSIVAVIEGAVEETTELLKLPFDHIFFTGSTKVGRIVMAAAAKNLSSVTLELGGKSPVIIDKSADIKDAAKKIVWGKFVNNGQTCIAPDYLFIDVQVKDKFINQIRIQTKNLFDSDSSGFENSDSYSRMVNENHSKRLSILLEDALGKGAVLEMGGGNNSDQKFMEPTLLSNISSDATIWKEEIFGPLLPIQTYQSTNEIIDHINSQPKPLALYVFSQDKKFANELQRKTSSGSMCINDVVIQYSHPNLPFGGVNESGIGKSHGYYGFLDFSNAKSVIRQRIGLTNASAFYPPFGELKRKIIDFMIKYF